MHVKYLAGIVGAALLMAGCSSSNELSAAGQSVRIVDEQPGAECQLIGTATGKQSNWLSGQHGEEGGSMRGAANDLRNQAAAMGGNVIYGISSPSQGMLSSFVPTDSQIIGQVYKCPNRWDPEAGYFQPRSKTDGIISPAVQFCWWIEHVSDAARVSIDPGLAVGRYLPLRCEHRPDMAHPRVFSVGG